MKQFLFLLALLAVSIRPAAASTATSTDGGEINYEDGLDHTV